MFMRELLLRLEAERDGTPGRSGPGTIYFHEWKRYVLLRNPRFALKYLAATKSRRQEAAEVWQSRAKDGLRSESLPAPASD